MCIYINKLHKYSLYLKMHMYVRIFIYTYIEPKYINTTFSICVYICVYTYMKESKGQYMEGLGRGKKGKGMM